MHTSLLQQHLGQVMLMLMLKLAASKVPGEVAGPAMLTLGATLAFLQDVAGNVPEGATSEAQGYQRRCNSTSGAQIIDMENTSAITLNTTVARTITLKVAWGTADVANTITLRQWTVEVLN